MAGVIARVLAVWGVTVARASARDQSPAAISTAATAVATAPGPAYDAHERAHAIGRIGAVRVGRAILAGGRGQSKRNHGAASMTRPRGRRQGASKAAAPLSMIPDAISDFCQLTDWSEWDTDAIESAGYLAIQCASLATAAVRIAAGGPTQ